jgi:hypothetical protein
MGPLLGLSGSIVNQVGSTVAGWIKNPFNRSFFYWYFFPALAFVLFQQYVIGPLAFGAEPPNFVEYANTAFATSSAAPDFSLTEPSLAPTPEPTPAPPGFELPASDLTASDYFVGLLFSFLGVNLLYLVILPFIMGVVLNAIAFQLTRFYEGFVWPLSWLLAPLKRRNVEKSKALYSGLFDKRIEYLKLYRAAKKLEQAEAAGTPPAEGQPALADVQTQIGLIKREIQKLHEAIEQKTNNVAPLPSDLGRVTPTALGNTLAVTEERPFDRYGIDSVLFWPRLRAELDEATMQPVDGAKGVVDGMLNVSLLSYIAAVETIVVVILMLSRYTPVTADTNRLAPALLIVSALAALAVGYGAYRSAVSAARNMGEIMNTYFDYHRDAVLAKFNLKRPDALEDEKIMWFKLGAFLRRGESFYFPEESEMDM